MSLFVLLLVVAGVAVVLRSSLFQITAVEIRGVGGQRAAAVRRAAAVQPHEHLLTAPLKQAETRVERLAWVADAKVHRVPPSTVAIDVTERSPVLTLRVGGSSWQVDGEVVLVDGGRVDDAPVIRAGDLELPVPGRPIDDRAVREAVEVHQGLPTWLRRQVMAYEIGRSRDLVLELAVPSDAEASDETATVHVRFGGPSDLALKVEVIRVLLPEALERGGALDVRAPANPVIVQQAAVRSGAVEVP
jgi:cell division protein FtsQ